MIPEVQYYRTCSVTYLKLAVLSMKLCFGLWFRVSFLLVSICFYTTVLSFPPMESAESKHSFHDVINEATLACEQLTLSLPKGENGHAQLWLDPD